MENAQRVAAQTNRLVLIHFCAPWCGKCNKMESEVFNQPAVAAILLANYVPVKINADQMPDTAKKFGITGLPTDVIITPQGQIVDSMRGQIEATQYLAHLNRIASLRRQSTAETAQTPANIPARPVDKPADRPAAETSAAGNQSLAGAPPSDDRYADYYRRNPSNQPVLSAPMPAADPSQPSPAPISPPYGQQQSGIGPELSGPAIAQSTSTPGQQVRDLTPPPGTNNPPPSPPPLSSAISSATVPQQAPASPPQLALASPPQPPALNAAQPPALNAAQQPPLGFNPSPPPPLANAGPPAVPASNPTLSLPSPNPPVCLDGYCPVSLTEKQQWVSGDRRYGIIHRGRLYLFTGPDEQRRFFADPDRYAPVISGNDIVQAMEKGRAVPGMREHGVFFNGHVFLFADEASLEKFRKNPAYYANQALEAIQASNRTAQQMR